MRTLRAVLAWWSGVRAGWCARGVVDWGRRAGRRAGGRRSQHPLCTDADHEGSMDSELVGRRRLLLQRKAVHGRHDMAGSDRAAQVASLLANLEGRMGHERMLPSPPPGPPPVQFLSSDGVQLWGGNTYRMDWKMPPPCNPLAFWAVQVIDLDTLTCTQWAAGLGCSWQLAPNNRSRKPAALLLRRSERRGAICQRGRPVRTRQRGHIHPCLPAPISPVWHLPSQMDGHFWLCGGGLLCVTQQLHPCEAGRLLHHHVSGPCAAAWRAAACHSCRPHSNHLRWAPPRLPAAPRARLLTSAAWGLRNPASWARARTGSAPRCSSEPAGLCRACGPAAQRCSAARPQHA